MHIEATTALWFLIPALPICVYTFYVDMKHKRISNLTVWVLFASFLVLGVALLPFDGALWMSYFGGIWDNLLRKLPYDTLTWLEPLRPAPADGPLVKPPADQIPWRFYNYVIVFVVGFLFWMLRQMGAGDVKLAAVMVLFMDPRDAGTVMWICFAAILAATATTLLIRHTPLHRLAPEWAAWRQTSMDDPNTVGGGQRLTVPMGTGFGVTLCAYLALGALYGA
ncbi:type IV leader peptidase family protein [Shimia isoporae]|uniref:Type IV leader peptidase family protein n=1 Tax=Shimia isoporae TaxID=647720 RepID=A0A4R1N2J7_9RHOB|nr:prepilin peptidase [Shimia isoporae]TCK99439.1 type IV leader peptidase family protein [Shimia isoporae]